VSFVSITQSFNTTTSMGRLTLNVLLSFAQFEREVIGERVRDKIAASKRKGLWMGGPVPLGYVSVSKKLVIVENEAKTVRTIFRRYLELGSIQALATDLNNQGMRTKERIWSNDRTVGGGRFGTGPLAYLLRNRIYIGEIVHRGQVFEGDHQAIIDRDLFDAVQDKLKSGAVERSLKLKSTPSILTGKIFDDGGNRMTPSHTVKNGVRYRYYVSKAALGARGPAFRVPAIEIEGLVESAVQSQGERVRQSADGDHSLVERVVVGLGEIRIQMPAAPGMSDGAILTIPWKSQRGGVVSGTAVDRDSGGAEKNREAILTAITKSRLWVEELTNDQISIEDIANREGKGERYIRLLLPLAFSAPDVVEALAESRLGSVTLTQLSAQWPCSWRSQRQLV
jgi:hypothetical protein